MKVVIVYNREGKNVINLFGQPNQEKIGIPTIRRIAAALRKGGHQVKTIEAGKDLIEQLEHFMPRVVKGERPGMVFNVSYGIQGQARYTQVPSILEMVGVPYVASGPLAHSLALDKVVTKMILQQHCLPTPDFFVLQSNDQPLPALIYPLIVKPKNEAVSFGIKIVHDEPELRQAAQTIFGAFGQPVLVERYIEGREINVGLLGNNPPQVLPPVLLEFGQGPQIYTYEDKTRASGREISCVCPAPVSEVLLGQAQDLAKKAFSLLGCYDCARVDMRLDDHDNLYILEVNSLPSLGEHGSYLVGAEAVGLDFAGVINRLIDVACARYFGTPEPPDPTTKIEGQTSKVLAFVTQRRDQIEKRLQDWVGIAGRTSDPLGIQTTARHLDETLRDLGLRPLEEYTDHTLCAWATPAGLDDGTLLIGHMDVPGEENYPMQMFRRTAEWLYGDGIGASRAPLTMLEFAIRALRHVRILRSLKLGILIYSDEGRDGRYSAERIRTAAARAKRVLVLRPGNLGNYIVIQRRGHRHYRFQVVGEALKPGKVSKHPEALRWVWSRLEAFAELTSREQRVSVSAVQVKTETLPVHLPHRVTCMILATYPDADAIADLEDRIRACIGKTSLKWSLELVSDRPPMPERRANLDLAKQLTRLARQWDIPLKRESSVWPSVAGLVPEEVGCVCGLGPVARDLGTPDEAVERISMVQRTILLAEFLAQQAGR